MRDGIYPRSTAATEMKGVNWLTPVLNVRFHSVSMMNQVEGSVGEKGCETKRLAGCLAVKVKD